MSRYLERNPSGEDERELNQTLTELELKRAEISARLRSRSLCLF
jgi:hypothetical protein